MKRIQGETDEERWKQEKMHRSYNNGQAKVQSSDGTSSLIPAHNQQRTLLALVKLDIGVGNTQEIRVFHGDDIIQLVQDFCRLHDLEDKCIAHMVRHITHQINSAQSKEMVTSLKQQQSTQSSEKEEIFSQSTNASSKKQTLFSFNPPLPTASQKSQPIQSTHQFHSIPLVNKQVYPNDDPSTAALSTTIRDTRNRNNSETSNWSSTPSESNNEQKMRENYEKWHKFIGMKTSIHREDNQRTSKTPRNISGERDATGVPNTSSSTKHLVKTQATPERARLKSANTAATPTTYDLEYLDETQILERIRHEDLLPKTVSHTLLSPMSNFPISKHIQSQSASSQNRSSTPQTSSSFSQFDHRTNPVVAVVRQSQTPTPNSSHPNRRNLNHTPAISPREEMYQSKRRPPPPPLQLSNVEEIQNSSASNNTSYMELASSRQLTTGASPTSSVTPRRKSQLQFDQKPTPVVTQQSQNHMIPRTIKQSKDQYQQQPAQIKSPVSHSKVPGLDLRKINNNINPANHYHSPHSQSQSSRNTYFQTNADNSDQEESYFMQEGHLSERQYYPQSTRVDKTQNVSFDKAKLQMQSPLRQSTTTQSTGIKRTNDANAARKHSSHSTRSDHNISLNNKPTQPIPQNDYFSQPSQQSTTITTTTTNVLKVDLDLIKRSNKFPKPSSIAPPQSTQQQPTDDAYAIKREITSTDYSVISPTRTRLISENTLPHQTEVQSQSDQEFIRNYLQPPTNHNPRSAQQSFYNQAVTTTTTTATSTTQLQSLPQAEYEETQKKAKPSTSQVYTPLIPKVNQIQYQKQQQPKAPIQSESGTPSSQRASASSEELLVNRLLRQKDAKKPIASNTPLAQQQHQNQPQQQLGQIYDHQQAKSISQSQMHRSQTQQSPSLTSIDFERFLERNIFAEMDSDKDGFVSVLDVNIESLKTDILTIIQDFLFEMADNTHNKYSFVSFKQYLSKNPQKLEALFKIFSKRKPIDSIHSYTHPSKKEDQTSQPSQETSVPAWSSQRTTTTEPIKREIGSFGPQQSQQMQHTKNTQDWMNRTPVVQPNSPIQSHTDLGNFSFSEESSARQMANMQENRNNHQQQYSPQFQQYQPSQNQQNQLFDSYRDSQEPSFGQESENSTLHQIPTFGSSRNEPPNIVSGRYRQLFSKQFNPSAQQ